MNTNGWRHTRGYRTAAEPSWVDPLLHTPERPETNAVNDVCAWRNTAGEQLAAYATAAGVVVVNLTANEQVGYAACPVAGGFVRAVELNGDLYLANDGGGVFRLPWTTLRGDGTPIDWTPCLGTATKPALLSDGVTGLYAFADEGFSGSPHAGWLAVCVRLTAGAPLYNAEIVDLQTNRVYHGGAWWRNMSPRDVRGIGRRLYFLCGNFVNAKYDGAATATEGHGWRADATVCGTVGDPFDDDAVGGGWAHNGGPGAVTESEGALRLTVAADGEGAAGRLLAARNALLAGAVDLRTRLRISFPVAATDGAASVSFYVVLDDGREERLSLQRQRQIAGGTLGDTLRVLRNGAPAAAATFPAEQFDLRVTRSIDPLTGRSTVSLQHRLDEADDWMELARFAGLPGGAMNVGFFVANEWTSPIAAAVTEFGGDYAPDSAYEGMPTSDLTAFAAAEGPAGANGDSLFAGYADGMWGCNADSRNPGTSERFGEVRGPYVAAGLGYEALRGVDNHVRALACSPVAQLRRDNYGQLETEGVGVVAVGTAAGLSLVSLTDDAPIESFDEGTAQPLTDAVAQALAPAGGWAYGTPDGGGWLTPDVGPPPDTALVVRELPAAVLLGWVRPPTDDYDHSLLYRAAGAPGPLAWRVLREDGFDGSGRSVCFRGQEAFFDRSIAADGLYRYKLTHVDRSGNESAGVVGAAYLDEPEVTDVAINGGARVTEARGVVVAVSANSGADSGNTADEVGFVKIYEPGVNEAQAPLTGYEAGRLYPYVLSRGPAGTPASKEIAVRPFSRGRRAGAAQSATITLVDREATAAATIERSESFMLAWRFRGDEATPTDLNGDADSPPANLLDRRLGVKWRSADNSSAFVRLDFGAFVELRGLAVLAHNFGDFAKAAGSFGLTLRLTHLAGGEETIGAYDLTCQAGSTMMLLNLEQRRVRRLTLQIDYHGDDPQAPARFEIGRLLAVADAGIVQPRFNLADDFTWSIREHAKLYATPSTRYAVNPVNVRTARIALEDYAAEQRRPLNTAFAHVGRRRPVLLLLKPELLPTLSSPDYPSDARPEEMAIYGYLAGDALSWRMRGVDLGSASLEIEEATE